MNTTRTGRHVAARAALLAIVMALSLAQPAGALRVATYNLLNWPDANWTTRIDDFRIVMNAIDADIIVCQEVDTVTGCNNFVTYALNYYEPGKYKRMPFTNGPDSDNMCFYKAAVLDSISTVQIYTDVRYTSEYTLRPDGYSSSAADIKVLSTHLKAGSSSSDQTDRYYQALDIRNHMNEYPADSFFILGGDFNMYSGTESAFQVLTMSQADNDGRLKDPLDQVGYWHDSYSYRYLHTQSPNVDAGGMYTGGGMDDRYDMLLISYALDDGDAYSYVSGSYTAFGNDGSRLNVDINDPPNTAVADSIADALYVASDHIPVYMDIQVPAKVEAVASLGVGTAIVGGTLSETLTVSNSADVPADELAYTLAAPTGFTAPGGSFTADAGVAGNAHDIGLDTSAPGQKSGDLIVSSNDLDHADWYVALTGTVLSHAEPSLSSTGVLTSDTLDFGSHGIGEFSDEQLSVYNDGYSSLQALLSVYDAEITGSDAARFSFVGGFSAADVGGVAASYDIAFDDAGTQTDSLYTAALTFRTSDDQSIAGAAYQDDLVVQLRAHVSEGVGVPGDAVTSVALGAGAPNPFTESTTLTLSLPSAAAVAVRIYDVSGRLVTTLVSGTMPAGVHEVAWDGRDERGSDAPSGIYFCRAEVGDWSDSRKVILLR